MSNSTILNIESDHTFYRNYMIGKWTLNENNLSLSPSEDLNLSNWNYEILEANTETLKLKILLKEGQYCCDFEEFEEGEILTIIEEYTKSE